MLFETATEWAALALTLLGGWLLGLASHSGGRKWRDRYTTERDAHAAYRRDMEGRFRDYDADRDRLGRADARVAELERDREALDHDRETMGRDREALDRAHARIAELERENDRLAHAGPVGRPMEPPMAPVGRPGEPPMEPMRRPVDRQMEPPPRRVPFGDRPRRGWFDWGPSGDPRARRF